VNPAPVIAAPEILTVAVPVLVTITVCVAVPPTETFPKLTLVGLGVRTPVPGVPDCPPPGSPTEVYPAQLESATLARTTRKIARKANSLLGPLEQDNPCCVCVRDLMVHTV